MAGKMYTVESDAEFIKQLEIVLQNLTDNKKAITELMIVALFKDGTETFEALGNLERVCEASFSASMELSQQVGTLPDYGTVH